VQSHLFDLQIIIEAKKKGGKVMKTESEPKHLDFLVKTQLAIEKIRVATQVRNSHLHLRGESDPVCEELQQRVQAVEDFVDKTVADAIKSHPAYDWFSRVKGVGRENIGKVISEIRIKPDPEDPEKPYARHASSIHKFGGFDVGEDGKAPRAEKGKKLTFSRQLRTMAWRLATSLNRARGKYHEYFLKEKERYRKRFLNNGFEIIPSEKLPTREGKKYEPEGVISLGHLDNMAKRKMIKLFLSHLFIVWREAEGLPAEKPWALEHGGHEHFIDPWEMVENKKPRGKKPGEKKPGEKERAETAEKTKIEERALEEE